MATIASLYSAKPTFMCLDNPEVIPDSLMPKEKVQELILMGQPIADEHIANIAGAAARNHFLTGIRLEHQRIGAGALRALAEAFSSNTNLKCLCLRYNGIDDSGAAELANLIGDSKSLIVLDLSFNDISDSGAEVLASALSSGSVLQYLDLRWNNIRGRGGELLHQVRVNGQCKHVFLDGNAGNVVETPQAEKKVKKSMKSQVMRSMKSTSAPVTYDYDFTVGDTVEIPGEGGVGDNRIGICAYVGKTKFADGVWVGVKFEKPIGKNDGSVSGKTYFKCAKFHGSFVRPEHVELIEKKGGDGSGSLDHSSLRDSSDLGGSTNGKTYSRRNGPGSAQVRPMIPDKPKGGGGKGGPTASGQLIKENQDLRARVAQLEAKLQRLQGATGNSEPIPRLDDVSASTLSTPSSTASSFRSSPAAPKRQGSWGARSSGPAAGASPSVPAKPKMPPKPSGTSSPSLPAKPRMPPKPQAPPKPGAGGGRPPSAPPKPHAPPKPSAGDSDDADLRQSEVIGKGFEGRTALAAGTADHTAIEGNFQVRLRTASGDQLSSGGHNMKAMITGPRGQVIEAKCVDNTNGTYDFSYTVNGPGDYTIIITCDSAPVAASPYVKSYHVPKEKKKRPVSMGLGKRNPFKSK